MAVCLVLLGGAVRREQRLIGCAVGGRLAARCGASSLATGDAPKNLAVECASPPIIDHDRPRFSTHQRRIAPQAPPGEVVARPPLVAGVCGGPPGVSGSQTNDEEQVHPSTRWPKTTTTAGLSWRDDLAGSWAWSFEVWQSFTPITPGRPTCRARGTATAPARGSALPHPHRGFPAHPDEE